MNVLILTNNDSGIYQFRKELVEALIEEHNVVCCTPDEDGYISKIEAMGCHCIVFNYNRRGINPIEDLDILRRYKKIIRETNADIVFTYTIKPNVYGGLACGWTNTPYVANITGLGTAIENGGLLQFIGLTLYKAGLRKAQKVFFQNSENRDFMVDHGVVNGEYDLLPGSGVNLNHFTVTPYPDKETIDFVYISRVMKQKGIDQYLDAARAIRTLYPASRFHICGKCDEDYTDTLNKLQEDGTIIYHGMVHDMTTIYEMAACVVHPSYYPEGLSNVLLEASASGRPIITTDRSGCREVIDNGINGYIVKQQDSHDLIEKIKQFMELSLDDRRAMGLAGRAKVEREFDRRIVVRKYMNEIKKVKAND